MKTKVTDALVAILFLYSSFESLQQYSSLGVPSVLFALFYFVSGFVVFRAYPWARYILYINSAILLLIVAIGLYITEFEAWYISLVPILLAFIFAAFGYYRYRGVIEKQPFRKEVLIFVLSLTVFSSAIVTIDHLIQPSRNVLGVYRLK